ncbi:MAG: F0F1 ATP synthase subunit delta [Omnitrophica bacterium]|nr:F0F1 ATP synthase subunit delta [Candidatus Omnitrophota bacterium]
MLLQMVIIQVITFFAIVLVLRKLLYAETAREAKRLRALKEENAQKERELTEKINTAKNAYKEKISKAEEDARALKERTEKEMEEARRTMTDKAKAEADRIVSVAVNSKEKMREEIANEMQKKVPIAATQICKDFLSSDMREIAHKELLREVVSEVKKVDKSKFTVKTKKGELISAHSLTKAEKNQITSAIFSKMGRKIQFDDKEDKSLVAGVVIKLGALVIDASLENRLKQFEQR